MCMYLCPYLCISCMYYFPISYMSLLHLFADFSLEWLCELNYKSTAGHSETV